MRLTSALPWPSCLLHVCRAVPLPDPACQTELFGIGCKTTASCIWGGVIKEREKNEDVLKEMAIRLLAGFLLKKAAKD